MSSIHDVARYSGVSTATVSRALRGLPNVSPRTRQIVQAAAAELGYVPSPTAAGLSSGRHLAVAIVVPSMGRWFYTKVVEGATTELRTQGYDPFLIDLAVGPGERERLFTNSVLRRRADAVVALGIDFTAPERKELRSLALPVVVVGGPVPGVRSVGVDDVRAADLAVGHLIDLGHRRIAHVGGENEYGMDHTVAHIRRQHWAKRLADAGLPPGLFVSGGFLMPEAKQASMELLRRHDRPTAVFAGSDEMAFGVLLAARDLGLRVPEDVSIVGVDDHSWSASFGLTTVRQDPTDQGTTAVRIVLDQLAGRPPRPRVVHSPSELVVRSTTAAASEDLVR